MSPNLCLVKISVRKLLRTPPSNRGRMLTYADVCWRMLTYADVCWRMAGLRTPPSNRYYQRLRQKRTKSILIKIYFFFGKQKQNTTVLWGPHSSSPAQAMSFSTVTSAYAMPTCCCARACDTSSPTRYATTAHAAYSMQRLTSAYAMRHTSAYAYAVC